MTAPAEFDAAVGWRLAAVMPCEKPYGVMHPGECASAQKRFSCEGCQGDGTRVVITATELERTRVDFNLFSEEFEYDPSNEAGDLVWREKESE